MVIKVVNSNKKFICYELLLTFLLFQLSPTLAYADPVVLFSERGAQPGDALGTSLTCVDRFLTQNSSDAVIGIPGIQSVGTLLVRDLSTTRTFISGNDMFRGLGSSVAPVGDIDGDGREDILAGAASYDPASFPSIAQIFFSSGLGPITLIEPNISVASNLGFAVAPLFADVNDNGKPDVIVSAPDFNGNQGIVVFFDTDVSNPAPFDVFLSPGTQDQFGYSLTSIADQDSDGGRDFLVGAPAYDIGSGTLTGRVVAFGGFYPDFNPIFEVLGQSDGDRFGSSVASFGDSNGDGKEDFLVGSPFADTQGGGTSSGQVSLFGWVTTDPQFPFIDTICTIDGEAPGDGFGTSVKNIGDFDGDDLEDFAIGAPGVDLPTNIDAGAVYIYTVIGSNCFLLSKTFGTVSQEGLGISISDRPNIGGTCDLNGDGSPEFGVGSLGGPNDDSNLSGGIATFFTNLPITPTPTVTATVSPAVTGTPTETPTPTPTETPTPISSQTVTPSPTPTGPEGSLGTPAPSPIITPTITPTPPLPAPPSLYKFKISGTGNLSGNNTYEITPRANCTFTLYGRRSTLDLKRPGPIKVLIKDAPVSDDTRIVARRLRAAERDPNGVPYTYHMIVETSCGGEKAYSKVFSRSLRCGIEPKININAWEEQLARKIQAVNLKP